MQHAPGPPTAHEAHAQEPYDDGPAPRFDPETDEIVIDTTTFDVQGARHMSEADFLFFDNTGGETLDERITDLRDRGFRVIRRIPSDSILAHELEAACERFETVAQNNFGLGGRDDEQHAASKFRELVDTVIAR